MKYISQSIGDTHKIAQKILKELITKHDGLKALIIVLKGDLGVGKTEFVKGLKKYLQIDNNILSPTFVVMKVYDIHKTGFNYKKLYHFDLYRFKNDKTKNIDKELLTMNGLDVLNDKNNIVFIEWGEKTPILRKYKIIEIDIAMLREQQREIDLRGL